MSATPLLSALMVLVAQTGPVAQGDAHPDHGAFAEAVKEYKTFVTPRCAPEMVAPYLSHVWSRDAGFVRSLNGTDLQPVYARAVREQKAREAHTVVHCDGPPPPPPPPGTTAPAPAPAPDPRTAAIVAAQEDLRESADALPDYFDQADAFFARMVELRDKLLAHTEE